LTAGLKSAKRVAVIGIGSELRADDAAGVLLVRSLDRNRAGKRDLAGKGPELKAFDGSTAPENITGEIIRFKPTHIIMVDTAEIRQKPGAVLLLGAKDLGEGVSFSTHKLPAKVLVDYFIKSLKCKVLFIGIQPRTIAFGKAVSKEVKDSVKEVSAAIIGAAKARV